ncbi:toprim domain-containing protein [Candidatus Woesearchaeota archaeon]|nr:toprim domain-containing protein [Candidatus Woesearchaeota archaeon]
MNNIEELLEQLTKLRNSNRLVIVEGKKDKACLEKFDIIKVQTLKEPIYKVVEEISKESKEVVILTDLDSEGKKLFSKLRRHLQEHGVTIDNQFREFLFKKTKLRQIEGLARYINNSS